MWNSVTMRELLDRLEQPKGALKPEATAANLKVRALDMPEKWLELLDSCVYIIISYKKGRRVMKKEQDGILKELNG